jgi:hypothetical protein
MDAFYLAETEELLYRNTLFFFFFLKKNRWFANQMRSKSTSRSNPINSGLILKQRPYRVLENQS